LPNGFKNDSDSLGESGGSAPHEDQDLELKKQELELCQTGPKDQLADIFTKPLDEQTFNKLRHELNILDSRNFFC
jgi:hypothetical protein